MADSELLKKYFADSLKTKIGVCNKLGISRPYFDRILDSPEIVTYGLAMKIKEEFNIDAKDMKPIFLP